MDEPGAVSPKPSEPSLRRTHPAPKFGPTRVQEPEESASSSLDDTKSMQIFVYANGPKPFILDVTRNTTTEETKMLVHKRSGTPAYQQRLMYAGRQLKPLRTLKDYDVKPESTIHMVVRLHGGAEEGPPPETTYTFSSQMRAIFFNPYARLFNRDGATNRVPTPYTFSSQMRAIFFNSYPPSFDAFHPGRIRGVLLSCQPDSGVRNQLSRHYTQFS